MRLTNPGFSVPLGTVKDANGDPVPLYISQTWQIFLQGLYARTGSGEIDRIENLEEVTVQLSAEAVDAAGAASNAERSARINAAAITANSTLIAANMKEIEFLGAFTWA